MSVQISSVTIINKIISSIEDRSGSHAKNELRYHCNDYKNFNKIKSHEAALGCMLLNLNNWAYTCRYNQKAADPVLNFDYKYYITKPIEAYKATEFFLYQCSETIVKDSELYKLIKKHFLLLSSDVISNLDAYKQIEWGA